MMPGRTGFQGYLMTIPVTVHGNQLPFIFDTGASSTFIMEKTARDLGLRILPDTIILNGNQKGLRAYIDSLQVGEVTVRNMIAYVGLPNALDGVVSGIDAVLGMDFINAIGETQILFDEWQLKFPYVQTPMPATGRNLTNDMLMKASKDGHMLQFILDTGDTTAELYAAYYEKFRKEVEADAVHDRITKGSYGNVSTIETLFLPNGVSFKVGSTPVNIDEIYLLPKSADRLHHHDGRMGMDLIRRFRKTTINLRNMFVKFEE
jgi:clan AA aspartic protease (TIGR02281 family)